MFDRNDLPEYTPMSPTRPIFLTKKIIFFDQLHSYGTACAHLVGSLGNISLEHESLLDFVEHSLGLVESGGVDTDFLSDFA